MKIYQDEFIRIPVKNNKEYKYLDFRIVQYRAQNRRLSFDTINKEWYAVSMVLSDYIVYNAWTRERLIEMLHTERVQEYFIEAEKEAKEVQERYEKWKKEQGELKNDYES